MTPAQKKEYNKEYYRTHKDYWKNYTPGGMGNISENQYYHKRYAEKGEEIKKLLRQSQRNAQNAAEYEAMAKDIYSKLMLADTVKNSSTSKKIRNELYKKYGLDPKKDKLSKVASRYERMANNLKTQSENARKLAERGQTVGLNAIYGDMVRTQRAPQVSNRPAPSARVDKRNVFDKAVDAGKSFIDAWKIGAGIKKKKKQVSYDKPIGPQNKLPAFSRTGK